LKIKEFKSKYTKLIEALENSKMDIEQAVSVIKIWEREKNKYSVRDVARIK